MSRSASSRLPSGIGGGCFLESLVAGPFRLEAAVGSLTRDTASALFASLFSLLSFRAATLPKYFEGPGSVMAGWSAAEADEVAS